KSPVYAFFDAEPQIEYGKSDTPDYLVYRCTKCSEKLWQGLKTGDRGSTGNMKDHVKKCWGEEALAAIKESTLDQARKAVRDLSKGKQSTLTAFLFHPNPACSARLDTPHSMVTACWAAESAHPFRIVSDCCYKWLQKEGRPNQYVPSKETVGRDVKILYAASKDHLVKEFQEYEYLIPIELDCWSSPNHRAFMSIIAHVLHKEKEDGPEALTEILLNFVELLCSHSGENMAKT
ncbi:hypothetical protein EV360DRAFT_16419, partial [Lentinula raphanica]